MKTIALQISSILVVCSLSLGISAQNYVPIPESNAFWCEYTLIWEGWEPSVIPTYSFTVGDTIINGTQYSKAYYSYGYYPDPWTQSMYVCSYRNDTSQKVYYVPKDSINEYLLYDFSLVTGDIIELKGILMWGGSLDWVFNVYAVDSVEIDGNYRKRMEMRLGTYPWGYWIEGIGSTKGFLRILDYIYMSSSEELNCFLHNDEIVFKNPDSYFSTCCGITGLNMQAAHDCRPKAYPNPSNGVFYLKGLPDNVTSVKIYNLFGRFIAEIPLNSETSAIDLTGYAPGLYLLLIDNAGAGQPQIIKVLLTN
ncbi:MAG: T9SS type A sorting domain-containing protein [Bacteroidales bacterium]